MKAPLMIDMGPVWLTLLLALVTTVVLLVIGTPLAWWLAHTKTRIKPVIEALTALPLVLPPTVLGFYLLIIMSPNAPLGRFWVEVTGHSLTFSFTGLVIASVFYSLPFTVQPLQAAFEAIGKAPLEAAAMLRESPWGQFWRVAAPMATRGFLTASVLSFAHTIGEFGVVLMVGGNIPGQTRVISIAIYEHVETLNYAHAHILSAGMLIFSFLILTFVYVMNRKLPVYGR